MAATFSDHHVRVHFVEFWVNKWHVRILLTESQFAAYCHHRVLHSARWNQPAVWVQKHAIPVWHQNQHFLHFFAVQAKYQSFSRSSHANTYVELVNIERQGSWNHWKMQSDLQRQAQNDKQNISQFIDEYDQLTCSSRCFETLLLEQRHTKHEFQDHQPSSPE